MTKTIIDELQLLEDIYKLVQPDKKEKIDPKVYDQPKGDNKTKKKEKPETRASF